MPAKLPPGEPDPPPVEVDHDDELEPQVAHCTHEAADDARWDAFLFDEDEFDPEPDPGDFWIEDQDWLADRSS
jgi:hypothetical protein